MKKILITLVIGFIVGLVIGQCWRQDIKHGPDTNDIKKHLYHDNNIGCYAMTPIAHICPFS
jgi:hypothetical protein